MKSITVDEYKTRIPSVNSDYFDNLSKELQDAYLVIYSMYSNLLTEYFIRNFKLDEYDEALIESPYSFPRVKEEDMDIYQYLASDKLKFVYIRNNLFVERLSLEEQKFIIEKAQKEDVRYDEAINEFIGSTFKRVMFSNPKGENSISICYGPDNKNFMAPDNAIVIGIRYDDYQKLPGQSSEDWAEENNNRLQDVETISAILENRMSKDSGIKTVAIKYNEFSIKKKVAVNTDDKEKIM